jgi:hypothetical protein
VVMEHAGMLFDKSYINDTILPDTRLLYCVSIPVVICPLKWTDLVRSPGIVNKEKRER